MSPHQHLASIAFVGLASLASTNASHAQSGVDFSGTVTFGLNRTTIGGIPGLDARLSGGSLDLNTDIRFQGGFALGLDFGLARNSIAIGGVGTVASIELIGLAIEPAYHFGNGAYAGAYYRMGDTDLSIPAIPITLGVDTRAYGLFAGYERGPMWVEGFIGRSNTDPSLPGGISIRDYGIAGSYDVNQNVAVFGSVIRTDIDVLGAAVNLTALSLGAEYDFGNNFSVYGSVGRLGIGLGPLGQFNTTGATIGSAYTFMAGGTPMVLNAEYSRASIGGIPGLTPNADRVAVGLTIPLGGGSSTPLNSNTATARGSYRSAIAALVNSL